VSVVTVVVVVCRYEKGGGGGVDSSVVMETAVQEACAMDDPDKLIMRDEDSGK